MVEKVQYQNTPVQKVLAETNLISFNKNFFSKNRNPPKQINVRRKNFTAIFLLFHLFHFKSKFKL